MSAGEETPISPSPAKTKKQAGRPAISAAENYRRKIERLQDELKQAQATFEEFEKQRASLVGAAAMRFSRRNAEFARQLAAALRAEIKAKSDRAVVADLLSDATTGSQAPR
jgi:phosphoenolpyruvate carboxylase